MRFTGIARPWSNAGLRHCLIRELVLFEAKGLQSVSCGHDLLQAKPESPCFPCNK
jgi:hypothetical protein